jgi:uncharacterized phage-like protein YoqJ
MRQQSKQVQGVVCDERAACFTGHRNLPKGDLLPFAERLLNTVNELASRGITNFKCGGALGFDTFAAVAVLKARKQNPAITLEMVLPCKDQAVGWSDYDRDLYSRILSQADGIVYISEKYYDGCMAVRNRRLVENSHVCVAYITRPRSGASQTVRLAKERNIEVINLAQIG